MALERSSAGHIRGGFCREQEGANREELRVSSADKTLRSDPLILRRCLSSLSPVAMVQADDLRNGYDAALLPRFHASRFWRILGQRQVRARVLVVHEYRLSILVVVDR